MKITQLIALIKKLGLGGLPHRLKRKPLATYYNDGYERVPEWIQAQYRERHAKEETK